jgi:2-C-methyl-D-erythritol 4-phosphate cytidylyltransferase/2-C-methyl-D-erythritol 2,4-cyclodiphosphate synthase
VGGGPTRQASVRAGLTAIAEDVPFVVCHDAARPFAPVALFDSVLEALEGPDGADGAVPVLPISDTVKRVKDGVVIATEDRNELWISQTPQAFTASALREAHERPSAEGMEFTDDAAVVAWAGYRVVTVAGSVGNFKITTAQDLERAELVARELALG